MQQDDAIIKKGKEIKLSKVKTRTSALLKNHLSSFYMMKSLLCNAGVFQNKDGVKFAGSRVKFIFDNMMSLKFLPSRTNATHAG